MVCVVILLSCQKGEPVHDKEFHFTIDLIGSLPDPINECSGFCYYENHLLIINDSDNGPIIYRLDPLSMEIVEQVHLIGVNNIDWEAITCSGGFAILGDFGNNFGSRTDLKLYHLSLPKLSLEETVDFSFPDQASFNDPFHNYDCEAMILLNGKYYLFTKNTRNNKTNMYSASLHSSDFSLLDSVVVTARVTDAYYHNSSDQILLLCNELRNGSFVSFIEVIEILSDDKIVSVGCIPIGVNEQFESLVMKDQNTFYIGSESEIGNGGNLYSLEITNL